MEIIVRAVGALASLMVVLFVAATVIQSLSLKPLDAGVLPKGLHLPALAMEFVTDVREVTDFLGPRDAGDPRSMRARLRQGLYSDYLFISMYWLLFIGMSVLLAARGPRWAVWVGSAAAVGATATALFDVIENLSIAALVEAREVEHYLVSNVASAGFGKWLYFGLTTLLLSLLFLRRDWLAALCAGYALIGLLCLVGLLGKRPLLVEVSFLLTAVGLVPLALICTLWPHKLLT